jgi:hypothetical protein
MSHTLGYVIDSRTEREVDQPPGYGLEPMEVTVQHIDPGRVQITVRAPQLLYGEVGDPASWTQIVRTEAPYGQPTTVMLRGDSADQTTPFVVRVERLKP